MKRFPIVALVSVLLNSCAQTDFSTRPHTAEVSGTTAPLHKWYFAGQGLLVVSQLDQRVVNAGTRTIKVDAGKHDLWVSSTEAGRVMAGPNVSYQGSLIGKFQVDFKEGHRYRVEAVAWSRQAKARMLDESQKPGNAVVAEVLLEVPTPENRPH